MSMIELRFLGDRIVALERETRTGTWRERARARRDLKSARRAARQAAAAIRRTRGR